MVSMGALFWTLRQENISKINENLQYLLQVDIAFKIGHGGILQYQSNFRDGILLIRLFIFFFFCYITF